MSEELTAKQKYQREYYSRNKDKICADKRGKYTKKSKPKSTTGTKSASKPKSTTGTKSVSKPKSTTRAKPAKKPSPRIITPTFDEVSPRPAQKVDRLSSRTRRTIDDYHLAKEYGLSPDEIS